MSPRREKLLHDRHLRDAARALVMADWDNLRADLSVRSLGGRAVDRLADGASEVYDEAMEVAADNKGALAAIVAALVLWFARNPIRGVIFGDEDN